MNNYLLSGDEMHPEINLDAENKVFKISGISRPENPKNYFQDCFEWVNSYLSDKENRQFHLEIFLDYFNTSSSKILLDMFEILEDYQSKGKDTRVIWCYEEGDDELFEAGEELLDLVDVPHEFKVIAE